MNPIPLTESTTTGTTLPGTSVGRRRKSKPEINALPEPLFFGGSVWGLVILLSSMFANFARTLLLGLLNAASLERRSLRGKPNVPVPVFDIVNVGPRHRFSTSRFVAHNCLGLGYGSGPTTFREFAKIYGVELTPQEAKKTVNDFREKESGIVDFWNYLDEALKLSARREEDYEISLPSGRDLVYRGCHYATTSTGRNNVKARMGGGRWGFTWGSKIAENVIQAIARYVFGECLLRLEAAGLESIFTVHDEVILEVDQSVTTKQVQDIIKINPDWMPGVPLDSEAEESDFYKK